VTLKSSDETIGSGENDEARAASRRFDSGPRGWVSVTSDLIDLRERLGASGHFDCFFRGKLPFRGFLGPSERDLRVRLTRPHIDDPAPVHQPQKMRTTAQFVQPAAH